MNIPDEIIRSFQEIVTFIGDRFFDEDNILAFVKRKIILEGKTLYIHDSILTPGRSGFTVALIDSYVICINSQLDELRKLTTRLHEYAHIILDHLQSSPYTYDEFKQVNICDTYILYHQPSSSYDSPSEYMAELFAMLLLEQIDQSKKSTPTLIQYMYGYKKD